MARSHRAQTSGCVSSNLTGDTMTKIIIKVTNPVFIKVMKEYQAEKKKRFEEYFKKIKEAGVAYPNR